MWTQRKLGWKRHHDFANKAALLQSNSHYFSAHCLLLLWVVHMPLLIPHRPRGRPGDYPCGSWERQNTSRSILLWLTAKKTLLNRSILPLHGQISHLIAHRQLPKFSASITNLNLSLIWHTDSRLGVDRMQIEIKTFETSKQAYN